MVYFREIFINILQSIIVIGLHHVGLTEETNLKLDRNELFYLLYLVQYWCCSVKAWDLNRCWI